MTRRMTTTIAAVLSLLSAAACGEGVIVPTGLDRDEIAGIYSICTLVFDPEGDLDPADVRTRAFELQNPNVRQPQVQVDANGDFQLVFTPIGQFVERSILGRFTTTRTEAVLSFTGGTAAPEAFLLPTPLRLEFTASPKALFGAPTSLYEVNRSDYARIAGVSESGLASRIPGRLTVHLSAIGSACP
jgi:hypothetical protein